MSWAYAYYAYVTRVVVPPQADDGGGAIGGGSALAIHDRAASVILDRAGATIYSRV